MALEEKKEQFERQYQAGKDALERGQYRQSVQYLEKASQLVEPGTRTGGETQIWLVSAYQAAQMNQEAIALCQKLTKHPHPQIRQQSKRLLYIMEAPRLKRPKEWMSEIPDLTTLSESELEFRRNRGAVKLKPKQKDTIEPIEPIEPIEVNSKDNQFIWLALVLFAIILSGLVWFQP